MGGGAQGAFGSHIRVADRPVTQHGVAGMKTGMKGEWLLGRVERRGEWLLGRVERRGEWLLGRVEKRGEWLLGRVERMREWVLGRVERRGECVLGRVERMGEWLLGRVGTEVMSLSLTVPRIDLIRLDWSH